MFSQNALYLVHAMIGGRGFLGFVLIAIAKMEIFPTLSVFQTNIKIMRRYEGCYYTRLESYYIIFYFESDWSCIRPLPSTTLTLRALSLFSKFFPIPTLATLLHIIWPPFTFSTPNLAPFPTWSTTSTNLLAGTQKSPSAS